MSTDKHPLALLRLEGIKVGADGEHVRLRNIRHLGKERQLKMTEYVKQNKAEILDGLRRGIRDGLPCGGWTPTDPAIGGYATMEKLLEAINRENACGVLWLCPKVKGWVYQIECPDERVCWKYQAALGKAA